MNIDFSLPNVLDNWELKYYGKFEQEYKTDENCTKSTGDLVLFIANNNKLLAEEPLMRFLDKIEQKFNVKKQGILQGVQVTQARTEALTQDKSETPEEDEVKDTPFVKSIRYIKQLYPRIAVNALTKDILYYPDNDEVPRVLQLQTLFTQMRMAGYSVQKTNILDYLYSPDFTEQINPIKNILDEFPKWQPADDPDFIGGIFNQAEIKDADKETELFYKEVLKKWAVKCIANAIDDNALPNKQIMIFQGGQNARKTSLIRALIRPFNPYVKEQVELKSKEIQTKKAVTQNAFILNDEIDRFTAKELQEFKIISSADEVKFKQQGSYTEQSFRRRANFISSTNPGRFLTDTTGNVRFLIIPLANDMLNPVPASLLDDAEYFRMFWAQAYYYYKQHKNGLYNPELTSEELQKQAEINRKFTSYKNIEEAISLLYPPANGTVNAQFSSEEFLLELKTNPSIPPALVSGLKPVTLGRLLNGLGYEKTPTHTDGYQKYRYEFKINGK